jgi:hypothetical protein
MPEPMRVSLDLPELDRTDDPRGGSIVWAVCTVSTALIAGVVVWAIWLW